MQIILQRVSPRCGLTATYADQLCRTSTHHFDVTKTLERTLPEFIEPGWINVTHRGSGFEIGLAINARGLHLLIEERERRQSISGRRSQSDEWKERIISHMLCYETKYRKLA